MTILAKRMARMKGMTKYAASLLQIDASVSLLHKSDYKVLGDEQEAANKHESESKEFVKAFVLKMQTVREKKGAPKVMKGNYAPNLPVKISQKDMKAVSPPGCGIWRNQTRPGWCGHCPPLHAPAHPTSTMGRRKPPVSSCAAFGLNS